MTLLSAQPLIHGLAFLIYLSYLQTARALAQNGDGGAAQGVQPGDIGSTPTSAGNAGAEGPDTGAVNLSRGATIAIAVVVSLVVVVGITTTVLFYLAKKRQWKIRESLRRSARKVSNAVKAVATPITPKRMTFPSTEKGRSASRKGESNSRTNPHRDVEKGLPKSAVKVAASDDSEDGGAQKQERKKHRPPQVSIPRSSFEIDSPKTPMWKKVFGR